MQRRRKLVNVLVLVSLLVMLVAPTASAQFTPTIFAVDQDVVDGVVNITRVVSDGPGWVVIHADNNGAPGAVIGQAAVPAGISANVKVEVDASAVTPVIHPMLHVDAGVEGTYEFPGDDVPVSVNGEVIMTAINVPTVGASLAGTAVAAGFTTLVAAAQAADLVGELTEGGPYTVFAPTDEAFAALGEGALDSLTPEEIANILLYHVVPGVVPSSAITESIMVATVQGAELDVQVTDSGITVNGANVTTADVQAYNGVIHVIDAVLLPPAPEEAPAEEVAETAAVELPATIVDAAVGAGSFTTLVAAVQAAGLVDALSGEGPFTVFAPTDEAFAAIPQETLDTLLADPSGDLTQILLYHVVAGKVMAADLSEGLTAATLQGSELAFSLADGATVNGVNIIATDIETGNGVIHVIDAVLLPPAAEEAAAEGGEAAAGGEAAGSEAAAPEALPATGGAETNNSLITLLVSTLMVLMLAGAAFVTRSRSA